MATFYANPDDSNEPWLEKAAIDGYGFRIWHLMFFCFSGVLSIMILLGFCLKVRIPRTKQDIEADYQRKKITRKFRDRLKLIQNQDMDALDLRKAMEIVQEDYRNEYKDIENVLFVANTPSETNTCETGNKTKPINMQMTAEAQQSSSLVLKLRNICEPTKN